MLAVDPDDVAAIDPHALLGRGDAGRVDDEERGDARLLGEQGTNPGTVGVGADHAHQHDVHPETGQADGHVRRAPSRSISRATSITGTGASGERRVEVPST